MEPMGNETAVAVSDWKQIDTDDVGYSFWSMTIGDWECQVHPITNMNGVIVVEEYYAEVLWPNGDPLTCNYYESLSEAKENIVVQFNLILLKWMNAISGGRQS